MRGSGVVARHRTAIVSAVIGVLAGLLLSALVGGTPGRPRGPAAAETGPPAAEPAVHTVSLPSNVQTRDGAVKAAIAYVCSAQALLDLDPLAAEQLIRSMAANATADQQVTETLDQLTQVRELLAGGTGPIRYRQAALGVRVEAYEPSRAEIAVWNVGVLSREGIAPPQASWSVSAVALVWEGGGWRLLSENVVPGPAPILDDSAAPATATQLDAALEGFEMLGPVRS